MFYIFCLLLFLLSPSSLQSFSDKDWTSKSNGQELLLCRKCGADVADSHYIFNKYSPGAQKTEKRNLFGRQNVTVQTLINPFGVKFEIVTTEKARCNNVGSNQGADSWFPGHTWRICTCPNCGQHLGWTFEKSTDHQHAVEHEKDYVKLFYGLILNNILGENFTDSLITMPKMYRM
ncbi:protein cereblon-like [Epargyreus clarus]|uniref:protein cereblon-like n=1 Tax=Epargyreus clarus TaxID=520877 RepID=UPI003C2CCF17